MAEIQILNHEQAERICSEALSTPIPQYENEISQLSDTLTKIKQEWQSTGMDQQSYIQELNKQIKNLTIIKDESKKLFISISNYAVNSKQISSRAVDATIGSSYQGYDVEAGYTSAGNAVTATNPKNIMTEYVNEGSSIKRLAIVNENGSLGEIVTADGTSIADVASKYNVGIDQIAVDIGKNGASQVWVPATDLLD